MSAFKYFTRIELSCTNKGYCPSAVSATWSKVKARVATSGLCFYWSSTAGRSQAVQIWTVVEVASGRARHAWHKRHQKSSSWVGLMCSHLAALAREMAGICDTWLSCRGLYSYLGVLKFGYSDKSCYMPWQISKPASKSSFKALCEWWMDVHVGGWLTGCSYYITHQWHNILYQLTQACPHNVLHLLVRLIRSCCKTKRLAGSHSFATV